MTKQNKKTGKVKKEDFHSIMAKVNKQVSKVVSPLQVLLEPYLGNEWAEFTIKVTAQRINDGASFQDISITKKPKK